MIAQSVTAFERGPGGGPVAVAMSGGVDSSVAAALLQEAGFDVFGLTMDLFHPPGGRCGEDASPGCCGSGARRDAGAVAATLGIPFFVADFRRTFEKAVIEDFVAEYRRGRTPNPCLRCNRFVKFGPLLRRVGRLGAAALATGHYARVGMDAASGRWLLRKASDPAKDQSYFLYSLPQDVLARTIFPLGGLRKTEVRALAEKMRLPVARKPESQEICFVPDDDYVGFLKPRAPEAFRPGDIAGPDGRTIGRHGGIARYTVGQRKGLGIAAPRPLYVVGIDAAANRIMVGPNEALLRRRLLVEGVNWSAIEELKAPRTASVKIRSRHAEARAVLHPEVGGRIVVEFERAQRAATPGQAAVFYDGDVILGGGTIV
ncbi:MAG: tRNA 2-thiouridine(34) synthase MnmA [Acidobacteriota bacterium]|nr:tRNA 2-thiouridine(34) synthase MnmA [Acidobacteriota bacterium]